MDQDGKISQEVLDQRQQQLDSANAALKAAQTRVIESQHALEANTHDVELYKVNIADNTLVAPRDGRIQYRIANIGEVLPAGGKVFSMLDMNSHNCTLRNMAERPTRAFEFWLTADNGLSPRASRRGRSTD